MNVKKSVILRKSLAAALGLTLNANYPFASSKSGAKCDVSCLICHANIRSIMSHKNTIHQMLQNQIKPQILQQLPYATLKI